MPLELLVLILAAATLAFLTASWWGVRRLRHLHSRPAVAEPAHKVEAEQQQVAFILNPIKNKADDAADRVRDACREAGWPDPLMFKTTEADPGRTQAREALEAGADVVVVGGGDGTVRVVAGELAGTDTPLGLVPLGTGNLLARNLHLDVGHIAACVDTALHGHQRRIDTAAITLENGATGDRREDTFLVIGGVGMDAEILADTRDDLKKNVGWLAYGEASVRHLPGRRRRMSIVLDDGVPQIRSVRSVLLANCGLLPGGIDFVPDAVLDDGSLDVVVISPRSALGWIWMAAKVAFKHRGPTPVINYYRARKVQISVTQPTETQLDGDPAGSITSLTVQVRPADLLVRVGPSARTS